MRGFNSIAGPDFSPAPNFLIWLRSNFGVTGTVDGAITQINDSSPRSGPVTCVSPNRPVWSSNIFADAAKSGIYFEPPGSTDYLRVGQRVKLPRGATIFVAFITSVSDTTVTTTGNVPSTIVGDTGAGFRSAFGMNGGNVSYSYKPKASSTFSAVTSSGLTLADGAFHTMGVTHDAVTGQVTLWADGVAVGTGVRTYDAETAFDIVGVGNSKTDQWSGYMSELLIWGSALNDKQMVDLHTRAAGIWDDNAVFSPASLSLEGWWRASYSASPWTATASAGGSGGNGSLTEATNPPAAGTAVNGYTPADFDGTNDNISNATTMLTYISTTAGSIWCLFYADTAGTDAGAGSRIENDGLVHMNGGGTTFGMGYSTSGVTAAFYDTGFAYVELTSAAATGGWHLAQLRWDGTQMELRVDNGSWSSNGDANTLANFGNTGIILGKNYNAACFDGRILEVGTTTSALSDTDFDNIRSYCNSRYGVSV